MNVSEALDQLWEKIKECNLDAECADDEDLIVKALIHLRDDAELEFSEIDEEEKEPMTFAEYYNNFHELHPGDEMYVAD